MFLGSVACGWTSLLPSSCAIASAAVTPSWLALCASHGGAVTSPIAQMPGHVGAAHRVGVDMALGGFHAERFEPDILGVRHDPDGDDAMAELVLGRLAVAGLDLGGDALCVGLQALDAGAGEDRQALLGQALCELRADLRVLDRNDAVEHFDHRHLGAQVGVEAGELDPDRARADDQQFGRHFRRGHGVAIGPDALAVGLGERQVAGPGAGRDDDVLGGRARSSCRPRPSTLSLPLPVSFALAHHHA